MKTLSGVRLRLCRGERTAQEQWLPPKSGNHSALPFPGGRKLMQEQELVRDFQLYKDQASSEIFSFLIIIQIGYKG